MLMNNELICSEVSHGEIFTLQILGKFTFLHNALHFFKSSFILLRLLGQVQIKMLHLLLLEFLKDAKQFLLSENLSLI